jgi:hypothetical protein
LFKIIYTVSTFFVEIEKNQVGGGSACVIQAAAHATVIFNLVYARLKEPGLSPTVGKYLRWEGKLINIFLFFFNPNLRFFPIKY